jgi:hypothetical protein
VLAAAIVTAAIVLPDGGVAGTASPRPAPMSAIFGHCPKIADPINLRPGPVVRSAEGPDWAVATTSTGAQVVECTTEGGGHTTPVVTFEDGQKARARVETGVDEHVTIIYGQVAADVARLEVTATSDSPRIEAEVAGGLFAFERIDDLADPDVRAYDDQDGLLWQGRLPFL